jgi:putative hydrolase of HD superfamily
MTEKNHEQDYVEDILKFKTLNRLKQVYRVNSVGNRKESTAEHTWSALMLADFFMDKVDQKLDKLRVLELLMYHDIVEIEAGDTPLDPSNLYIAVSKNRKETQKENELLAAKKICSTLPEEIAGKFWACFNEFEAQKTIESRFASAIDVLDSQIHEIDYKEDWKGWSAEFLVSKKAKYFEEFPILKKAFYQLIEYFEKEGYFKQD